MGKLKISYPTASRLVFKVDFFIETILLTSPVIFFGVCLIESAVNSLVKVFRSGSLVMLWEPIFAVALGLFLFWGTYLFVKSVNFRQRVIFDSQSERITVIRYTIFGKKITEYDFGQIDNVALLGNDECYAVGVVMKDKNIIHLDNVYTNVGVDKMRQLIVIIKDFIGLSEEMGKPLESFVSDDWNG
jgi:hypothetical protein